MERQPVYAGSFYSADAVVLRDSVRRFLDVPVPLAQGGLRGLVVPHAGFVYSGPVAGYAYALLAAHAATVSRIVLLGPSHRVGFTGIALPVEDTFSCPLGTLRVDVDARALLARHSWVKTFPDAHREEHSLEVQLPFLCVATPSARIIPLVVGACEAEKVAEVLATLTAIKDTLVIVSSDLSHYHSYEVAKEVDQDTAQSIMALSAYIAPEQACGAYPLNGLLYHARHHDWFVQLLDLRNSGDTSGDKKQVVGYGAFAFVDKKEGLP